ncbi:MAG: hypothetical protein CVU84_05220 [Firmicutes bacterium HGW-Firmicutes-1]|jgi:NADH pyrophosphatase NudC (nudix superfamily)|nr:MAG: hypothetical protein CVU84_05220 [Firmicutes bacterium HGW-Firmicutes-1]
MADFFNKVKKGFNKGTTVISVKSSTMMETNKLKGEISSLKKEKTEIFTATGEKFYTMKKEGSVNIQELETVIARSFEIDQLIEQKEHGIEEAIKKQEDTLNSLDEESDDEDKIICSCGASVAMEVKFCPKCGNKMDYVEQEVVVEVVNEEDVQEEVVSEDITCECGATLPAGTVFCVQCGRKVN